ncbi:hypothetical protein BYT27DRAFT_7188709 [Phlegmacium glaucopus]|nr:hypothetical protein BYT27DRAFT_7188709 [Phlegmacium glaucopus]
MWHPLGPVLHLALHAFVALLRGNLLVGGPPVVYPACMSSSLAGSRYTAWLSRVFPRSAYDILGDLNQSFCKVIEVAFYCNLSPF